LMFQVAIRIRRLLGALALSLSKGEDGFSCFDRLGMRLLGAPNGSAPEFLADGDFDVA